MPDQSTSLIPIVERTEPTPLNTYTLPKDDEYNKGIFRSHADGELYALAIVENDPLGRNYKLKNTAHFSELSESEFRIAFEKA